MIEIEYRQGKKRDCAKLAEFINMASDGVVEYLFRDLVPGMTPVQVVTHNLKRDDGPHSYKSAAVAMDNDDVVGMALSYPSAHHKITPEMRGFFPADRLEHLGPFYSARIENTWYLDTLGVTESHRRRGIGERLISLTKERSAENGFHVLSLIVFADNTTAISVYERTGFTVERKVELSGNDLIRHEGGCLLMKCDLN
jgi:ribosomal protein S18 acetylase RimI-like enzyme